MTDSTIHASDIQQAQARISSEIAPTPLQYCARLSAETGCEVYLKREDLQDVRSYKIRGALNGMSNLPQEQRHRGIVTASAGNHAQGVAYACRTMGIAGKIFVPEPTPMQKRDRILVHGGDQVELVVVGSNFDEAAAAAHADAAERDAAFIEPFDARDTITGQGTVAAEVLAQLLAKGKSLDTIVVPVGGGGLISGITSYVADMAPQTRVVGMEPEGAASLRAAFDHGGPVTLEEVDPFVDGAAVKRLGALPYEILQANRERLSFDTVSEGAVCTDLLNLYQNEGIIAEPAGALSVAGLHQLDLEPGSTVVCVISGGNNDVLRYAEIMERSLVHRGLKHYFLVNFPQEPGQLRHFLHEILGPTDDITLFEYLKRNNRETGAALVGLQLSRAEDLDGLLGRMGESKISVQYLKPGTPEYEFLVA